MALNLASIVSVVLDILEVNDEEVTLGVLRRLGGGHSGAVGLLVDPDCTAAEALALARTFMELGRMAEATEVVEAVVRAELRIPEPLPHAWAGVAAVA